MASRTRHSAELRSTRASASSPRRAPRIVRTPPRSKSPARLAEQRLKDRRQHLQQCLLHQPIPHRREDQPPLAPARLRYLYPPHGTRRPASRHELRPDFLTVTLRDVASGIRVDRWACRRPPPRRRCVLPPPAPAAGSLQPPLVASDRRASLSVESLAARGLATAGRGSPRLHRFCLGLLPCLVTPAGEDLPVRDCGSSIGSAKVAPLALLLGPSALRLDRISRPSHYGFC